MTDINKDKKQLNSCGEFSDVSIEKKFRDETWIRLSDRIGKTALLAGLFFLMAGTAPFFIAEVNDIALKLFLLRAMIALWGIFIYFLSNLTVRKKLLLINVAVLIIMMGLFESYEAVLSYRPEFEYNIPFTLLIILLSYLMFPLSIKSVAPASVFSSIAYITALGFFTAAQWTDLIQLSVFFLFVNLMGLYIFIELSKNRRYRYLSYNEIKKLYSLLNTEIQKKDEANKKLSILAETDELTGIANRRKFFSSINSEFTKAVRYKRPLSLLMMDIDYFKKINDTYGHDSGDKVLVEYVNRCIKKLRQSDIFARVGGEEFAVLLPETSKQGAYILAERIRQGIEEKVFRDNENSLQITSSCGIVSMESDEFDNISDFIKAADNALYRAKDSGRNQCCISLKGNLNENN